MEHAIGMAARAIVLAEFNLVRANNTLCQPDFKQNYQFIFNIFNNVFKFYKLKLNH